MVTQQSGQPELMLWCCRIRELDPGGMGQQERDRQPWWTDKHMRQLTFIEGLLFGWQSQRLSVHHITGSLELSYKVNTMKNQFIQEEAETQGGNVT